MSGGALWYVSLFFFFYTITESQCTQAGLIGSSTAFDNTEQEWGYCGEKYDSQYTLSSFEMGKRLCSV